MGKERWFILMTLVMMVVGLFPQSVAADDANIYTTVSVSDITSGAAVTGATFTTDIKIGVTNNTVPPNGIMGVDLWLRFNNAVLSVDDADNNPANGTQVTVKNDFFGGSLVQATNEVTTCPGGGTCIHLALSHTGSAVTNHTGAIATVTWAALATGNTGLEIVLPDTVLADANGSAIAINSITVPAITVMAPGVIQSRVRRQGSRTDHGDIAITAYSTSNNVVGTTTTATNGNFSLSVPQGGTYLLQATYPGYLKSQRSNVYIAGATINLAETWLKGGDVNADNNINILDVVTIISRYGTTGWTPEDPVDINDDGIINIFDLTIAAGNFGRYGPVAW